MAEANPAQIEKTLGGVDYPASKQDLINHAKKDGANNDVVQILGQIPDKKYNSPIDVSKAVGKIE